MSITITPGGDPTKAGPPMPWTHDPGMLGGSARTLGAANRCHYYRLQGAGTISKIRLYIVASSGNLCVAVYAGTGSGASAAPGTQLATSGSVASPGTGAREISLGASVYVDNTCWIGLSADNNTISFSETNRATSNQIQQGLAGYQASAHPCPSSPSMTQSDGSVALEIVAIGVP